MSTKLHQNAVLCGRMHFCCLVCGNYFANEGDALSHITKKFHKRKLGASGFYQKLIKDKIRMVRNGFYCEYCNLFIPLETKLKDHTADYSHIRNKGIQNLERVGPSAIVFNKVPITKKAWNGIMGNSCLICDADFDDMDTHLCDKDHLFKLVQTEVEFTVNNGIYRSLKDNCFHCLMCDEVFKNSSQAYIAMHFALPQHRPDGQIKKKEIIVHEKPDDQHNNQGDDQDDDKIHIQVYDETRGIYEMEDIAEPPYSDSDDEDYIVKIPAERDEDAVNFCNCESFNIAHTCLGPLEQKSFLHNYIEDFFVIEHACPCNKDVVINGKLVINIFNFCFITKGDPVECHVCDVDLTLGKVDFHKTTAQHEANMRYLPVLVLKYRDNEFIREIRPDVYHCGYCNVVRYTYDGLLGHLTTGAHKNKKEAAASRLQVHLLKKRLMAGKPK